MLSSSTRGRPPVKQQRIVSDLRTRIIGGAYAPQARIPTRLELQRRYKASAATVQLALTQLAQDGFLQPRGPRGTFVTEHPPHLTRLVLAIPALPDAPDYPRLWTALARAALLMNPRRGDTCFIRVDHGLDGHRDSEPHIALERDVRHHRLGGLIFASNPFLLRGSPILEEPGIPRVAFMSRNDDMPALGKISMDIASLFAAALSRFAAEGRRRLAVIMTPGVESFLGAPVATLAAQHGLRNPPHLQLIANRQCPESARGFVRLLMHLPPAERPDALFISDDNLVEHASGGLFDAGARVPKDILVIAHSTFPCPTTSVVPVLHLGFDAREALRVAVAEAAHLRDGGKPRMHAISAVFESDLPPGNG